MEDSDTYLTQDDLIESDEVQWGLSVNNVWFNTRVTLPEDATASEAREIAKKRLIDALETGDAEVDWAETRTTRDDQEYTLSMQTSCERCGEIYPNANPLREIDTESDEYEPDFEHDGRYVLVCEDCRKSFWTWPEKREE